MCSNNNNNSFIEVSMYLVLTNNWGQAHRGVSFPLLSFQSGSKSVNTRQGKNHLSLSKSSIWEFLSKFMCISHPTQSSDQYTKINKTSIENTTLI